MTSGSLQNYYRGKSDGFDDNASNGKSFKYKIKTVGKTPEQPGNEGDADRPLVPALNVEVTISLKCLSIFL